MVPIEFLLIHESVVSVKLLPGRIGSCECVWEFGRRLSSFLVNAVAQLPVNVYQVTKLCLVLLCRCAWLWIGEGSLFGSHRCQAMDTAAIPRKPPNFAPTF
ncbi:hypothetical protein ATANTOWER_008515 [Ataeniobius toweri]|uniref:Uncharacterized protein n=1 Tax=Ataeniobius toweri TaxID=208326 RepID=A0ABU7BJX6_9TELE|nr:hypothetical protein [Ataeniobius toweri]